MKELSKILDTNEKTLWEGRPNFLPFVFGGTLPITIFGLFWMMILIPMIMSSFTDSGGLGYGIFLFPHFWIGIGMLFGPTLYKLLSFEHTYYAVTDKRIIFQGGVIGRDFKMVDFDQVTNAEVNVGVFDKLFGQNTGTVNIFSASGIAYSKNGPVNVPYALCNIQDPYEVFKFFKKVSYDIKTDIEYPNELRPKNNPGFQTDYQPKP